MWLQFGWLHKKGEMTNLTLKNYISQYASFRKWEQRNSTRKDSGEVPLRTLSINDKWTLWDVNDEWKWWNMALFSSHHDYCNQIGFKWIKSLYHSIFHFTSIFTVGWVAWGWPFSAFGTRNGKAETCVKIKN